MIYPTLKHSVCVCVCFVLVCVKQAVCFVVALVAVSFYRQVDKDVKRKLAEEAARRWQERDDKVGCYNHGLLPKEAL